jgi:adenylosuccinate synthase
MENELDWQVISDSSGIPLDELLAAERTTTTDKKRRVAEFDWNLLRKAATLNGPTDIVLTFADTSPSRIEKRDDLNNCQSPRYGWSKKSSGSPPHQCSSSRLDSILEVSLIAAHGKWNHN